MEGLTTELAVNEVRLRAQLAAGFDVVYRAFTTGYGQGTPGLLLCINGLADRQTLTDLLLAATRYTNPPYDSPDTPGHRLKDLLLTVVPATEVRLTGEMAKVIEAVLEGQTAVLLDGVAEALLVDTRWHPGRTVDEPQTESEVRGPRDGMVESVRVNTTLLRRRIRDPRLRFEPMQIGKVTRTDVVIAYINELAPHSLLQEVRQRLGRVQMDSVLESGYVEEMIRDHPLSPFGGLLYTERPDRVAAAVLEGRVAIMVDNTPFVMVAPTSFWQLLQTPGDYYHSFYVGTVLRWIRFTALLIGLTLPALYTMLTTYHHEMIPTPLALSMAAGKEGAPLPTLGEVLLMIVMFEVMNEAGLRLPRAVGQTVSIVGALVIGEAAVMAGLVAPSTVIVVATSGLSGFALPSYSLSLAVRLMRLPLLLASGVLGVFGYLMATTLLVVHLANMRSFGAPFMGPLAPLMVPDLKDTLVRFPWWAMLLRPKAGAKSRNQRAAPGQMPGPEPKGGAGS